MFRVTQVFIILVDIRKWKKKSMSTCDQFFCNLGSQRPIIYNEIVLLCTTVLEDLQLEVLL